MSKLFITWHAHMDDRTCLTCKVLNGYVWEFDAGADELGEFLVHPQFGIMWSLSLGSRSHGHDRYNCRCTITVEIDVEDILAKCVFLREEAYAINENYIPWRGGSLYVQ